MSVPARERTGRRGARDRGGVAQYYADPDRNISVCEGRDLVAGRRGGPGAGRATSRQRCLTTARHFLARRQFQLAGRYSSRALRSKIVLPSDFCKKT